MKHAPLVSAGLLVFASVATSTTYAQPQLPDVGRVLSSTPVMQQVSVPRQVCGQEQVEIQRPNSGAGAAIGAIAGGALGSASASGRGPGRAAATVIGAIGGAILGDRLEGTPPTQTEIVQRCQVQYLVESRVSGYNVVYEFGGKQYAVQLPQDPGPTIAVQVNPVGASQLAQSGPPPAVVYPSTYPPMNNGSIITSSTVTYPVVVPRYVPQVVFPRPYFPSYYERAIFPRFEGHHSEHGHDRGEHRGHVRRHWD